MEENPIFMDNTVINNVIKNTMNKKAYLAKLTKNNEDELIEDKGVMHKNKYLCNICGRKYTYSNYKKHVRTNFHNQFAKINKKWRDMILNN